VEPEIRGVAPQAEESAQTLPLHYYFFIVLRRKWVIIAALAFSLALATVITLRETKLYQASATMIIEETTPRVMDKVQEVTETPADSDKFYNTQVRLIQSSVVAQRAAVALGLDKDPKIAAGLTEKEAVEAAGATVLGCLSARAEKQSRVVTISCVDTDPERAARIANAVVQAYIDEVVTSRSLTTLDAVRFLATQADELRAKLERAERALYEFNEKNDLLATSFEESHRILSNNLLRLNEELSRVKADGILLRSQLEEARKVRKEKDPAVVAAMVGGSPVLSDLKHRRAELEKELMALRARYKEGHPKVLETSAALAAVDQACQKEIAQIYDGLEVKVQANEAQEKSLTQSIDKEMKRLLKLREREVEYNRLRREVEHSKEVYALVARRLKETELTRPLQQSNVRRLEPAVAPQAPFKPDLRTNLLLAFVLGLLGGFGLALLFEFLDDSVRSPEDVEQIVGVPLLGILPTIEPCRGKPTEVIERARAEHVLHRPTSLAAESCQTIATNIFSLFLKTQPKALMIASASADAGKTLCAINLAMSVAGRGRRVLLVDTDLRRGRLHKAFGVPRADGIYEILTQDKDFTSCLRETAHKNVLLLTSGNLPEKVTPLRLLELPEFAQLVEKLKESFDLVVFDSPPLGVVADGVHIGSLCDGVVLVARYRRSSRRALRAAVQALETAQVRVVGCVLNDLAPSTPQYRYYKAYGYAYRGRYGYAYGEGYAEEPEDRA